MTESERPSLRDSWDFLTPLAPGHGQEARDLPEFETAHGSVLLSQDSEGTRHVLIPIGPEELVTPDTSSRGVQLVKTSFDDQGRRRHFVDLRCPEPRLHRLFDQIATSMLDEVSTGEGPIPGTCARVLGNWRELLRRAARPVTATVLRGVLGELWFLARLAEHGPGALDYWTGPDQAPQDFIAASGAFELKTTLRNPARRVSISGIDQLDDEPHPFLVLVVLSLAEDPAGLSINVLVENLVEAGLGRDALLDRLARAGVQEDDLPQLSNHRWRITGHAAYLVDGEFPRLTATSIGSASGIHNLRYEIELGAATDGLLSAAALREYQAQFMTGAHP